MLFYIITNCSVINGYTVTDTSILKYNEDYKININSHDYNELMDIPYVDSTTAVKIIESEKKWGKILDYRMLRYVIGTEKATLISPYIVFLHPKLGFTVRSTIAYENKITFEQSVCYKGSGFILKGYYSMPKNDIRLLLGYKHGRARFWLGNYTVYLNPISLNAFPVKVYANRSDKRIGAAFKVDLNKHIMILSGKFNRFIVKDSNKCLNSNLQYLYGIRYNEGYFVVGISDSLIYTKGKIMNNLNYSLLSLLRHNSIIHSFSMTRRMKNIGVRYGGYFKKNNIVYSSRINCNYSEDERKWTDMIYQGLLSKNKGEIRFYMSSKSENEEKNNFYKVTMRKMYKYKSLQFKPGIYTIFNEKSETTKVVYPNLLINTNNNEAEMGIFLNIMYSLNNAAKMSGIVLANYIQYSPYGDLRVAISAYIFDIVENYEFENFGNTLYGSGKLKGRGALLKGGVSYSRKGVNTRFSFYLKRGEQYENKIRFDLTYSF